ncbi:calcium-binding protein [Leisingera sp. D0M16]|uniref:calcium-binding protein n=1 Tax=Leisingera coralii TaxID=3351347 RepID=UPI003B81E021
MEFLILLGIGLTIGGVAVAMDEDNDAADTTGETVTGTEEQDVLTGTELDDTVFGDPGDDAIEGAAGDDWLRGGVDSDVVLGGSGDDSISGSLGADWLQGDQGEDTLTGGFGADGLYGGEGADSILGGAGDDLLSGGVMYEVPQSEAADALDDFQGGLDVRFTPEYSNVSDDNTSDTLVGGEGWDTLIAGDGDVLIGGGGSNDFVTGYWADGSSAAVITDFNLDEDALFYYYVEAEPPQLTVETLDNEVGGQDSVLYADGVAVMHVNDTGGRFDLNTHVRLARSYALT